MGALAMSVYLYIDREPVYTIELDDEDDSEYQVPHWQNGVKLDDTKCGGCGAPIGPKVMVSQTTGTDVAHNAVEVGEPRIVWIPVYHRYRSNTLLCESCVEDDWYEHRDNLQLVAQYLNEVDAICHMLEHPRSYINEWWEAYDNEWANENGVVIPERTPA
jgi:hypothetical protein